jgi:hypothetical protein
MELGGTNFAFPKAVKMIPGALEEDTYSPNPSCGKLPLYSSEIPTHGDPLADIG